MSVRQPHYSKEEHAKRGTEIYQSTIRPLVEEGNYGKIVAIDIDTGSYEIAEDSLTASDRMFQRLPDAQIWFERIGFPAVHRIGPRILTETK